MADCRVGDRSEKRAEICPAPVSAVYTFCKSIKKREKILIFVEYYFSKTCRFLNEVQKH